MSIWNKQEREASETLQYLPPDLTLNPRTTPPKLEMLSVPVLMYVMDPEDVEVETLVATDHDRKAKGRSRVIGEGKGEGE
jgi:hypothetical protein